MAVINQKLEAEARAREYVSTINKNVVEIVSSHTILSLLLFSIGHKC